MAKKCPFLSLHVLFCLLKCHFSFYQHPPPSHICLANFPPSFRLQSKMTSYGKSP